MYSPNLSFSHDTFPKTIPVLFSKLFLTAFGKRYPRSWHFWIAGVFLQLSCTLDFSCDIHPSFGDGMAVSGWVWVGSAPWPLNFPWYKIISILHATKGANDPGWWRSSLRKLALYIHLKRWLNMMLPPRKTSFFVAQIENLGDLLNQCFWGSPRNP